MDTMRASGVQSGGQAKYGDRDKQTNKHGFVMYLW